MIFDDLEEYIRKIIESRYIDICPIIANLLISEKMTYRYPVS